MADQRILQCFISQKAQNYVQDLRSQQPMTDDQFVEMMLDWFKELQPHQRYEIVREPHLPTGNGQQTGPIDSL